MVLWGTWPHLLVASELENLKLQSGLCSSLGDKMSQGLRAGVWTQ